MSAPKRPSRGRPPRIERDIAVALAVAWHERAEGLGTVAATRAVRELWHLHGRRGLGHPSKPSKAVFACLRRARDFLGDDGSVVVLPGIEIGPVLTGAAAFHVPVTSTLTLSGAGRRRQAIRGPLWRWPFAAEEAEFVDGANESPSVGDGRVGAPPRAPLGQGSGWLMPGP